jgi:hypothetical protein
VTVVFEQIATAKVARRQALLSALGDDQPREDEQPDDDGRPARRCGDDAPSRACRCRLYTPAPMRRSRGSTETIINALLETQPTMLAAYGPGRCIVCTRIAIEVCRARGVRAEPLAVAVDFTTHLVEGRLGFEPDGVPPGNWNAHLVCIIDRCRLVDLTLDTAASPPLGLHLEPVVLTVPSGFMRGGTVETTINGTRVRYEAHPEERGFLRLEDWNDRPERERVQPLVERLLCRAG